MSFLLSRKLWVTLLSFSLLPFVVFAQENKIFFEQFRPTLTRDVSELRNLFPDVNLKTREGEAAVKLQNLGIIKGFSDGFFRGSQEITRGEALKILVTTAFGDISPTTENTQFSDVPPQQWYAPYVAFAVQKQIVKGYQDGTFRPDKTVTRAEFLVMLRKIFPNISCTTTTSTVYTDVNKADWFFAESMLSTKCNLFPENDSFRGNEVMSRNEFVVAIFEYLQHAQPESISEQEPIPNPETNEPSPPEEENPDAQDGQTNQQSDVSLLIENDTESLENSTYIAGTESIPLWTGIFTSQSLHDLTIRNIIFRNTGTIQDTDLTHITLSVQRNGEGSDQISQKLTGKMTHGNIALFTETRGLFVPAQAEILLTLVGNIPRTLSRDNATIQLQLSTDQLKVTDAQGKSVDVSSDVLLSPTLTLREIGTLGPKIESTQTPDSKILVEGQTDVLVATFDIPRTLEDIAVRDIEFLISEVDTSSTLGVDIANDRNAIETARLYADNGAAILTKTGAIAQTSSISNGKILFRNLDLSIPRGKEFHLFVGVDIANINDHSTGQSGMAFALRLENSNQHYILGVSSGRRYENFISESQTSEAMYVMTNRLGIRNVSQTQNLTNGDQRELLRFELTQENTVHDTFFHQVVAEIVPSGNVQVDTVGLYRNNKLLAFSQLPQSENTYVFEVGVEDVNGDGVSDVGSAVANGLSFDVSDLKELPAGSGKYFSALRGSDVYTLRANFSNVTKDDSVIASIRVNGSEPNTDADGISWRDEGRNGGDGITIKWINIPEDDSFTMVENLLRN